MSVSLERHHIDTLYLGQVPFNLLDDHAKYRGGTREFLISIMVPYKLRWRDYGNHVSKVKSFRKLLNELSSLNNYVLKSFKF